MSLLQRCMSAVALWGTGAVIMCMLALIAFAIMPDRDGYVRRPDFVAYWMDRPYAIGRYMNGSDGAVIFVGKRKPPLDALRSLMLRGGKIVGQTDEDNVCVGNVETVGQTKDIIFGTTHDGDHFILKKGPRELVDGMDEWQWEFTLREYGLHPSEALPFWDAYCNNSFDRAFKGLLLASVVVIGLLGWRRWSRRPGSAWAKEELAFVGPEPLAKGWMRSCAVLSGLSPIFVVLMIMGPRRWGGMAAMLPAVLWLVSAPETWTYIRRRRKWSLVAPLGLGGLAYATVIYGEMSRAATWFIMLYLS